jgi:hypothetical protein
MHRMEKLLEQELREARETIEQLKVQCEQLRHTSDA